jgi:hypothetical protein
VDFSEGISAKITKIIAEVRERIILERMEPSSGVFQIYAPLDREMHLVSRRLYVIILRKLPLPVNRIARIILENRSWSNNPA